MANTGVTGRVVYTGTSNGISNLIIQVVDLDAVPFEQSLGWTTTDASGNYSVTYPKSSYGALECKPDIVIRVYDKYLRLLHETVEVSNVSDTILLIPDISLHPKNVSGWLVSNATINPAGTPVNLSAGNEITFFIDNETAWAELTDAASSAITSINFQLLYWQVPEVITKFNIAPATREQLQVKFNEAVTRGIPVRVMMNDFHPDLFGLLDTAGEVSSFFSGSAVDVRLYSTFIPEPFHAKLMIVDGQTAYLIGSPIMNEYFDSRSHTIDDPRRGPFGISNAIRVPIHEVNTKVRGPAVNAIDNTFCLSWNRLRPTPTTLDLNPAPKMAAMSGSNIASVQVIRTTPGDAHLSMVAGETGILEAYQRGISQADDFIYIENQYFTSYELVDALVRRLRVSATVQVILLLNTKVDVPGYPALQTRVLDRLLKETARYLVQDRLGIFTLWSHEAYNSVTRIVRNYVHSKTAIIDDKWATVGSANTDGTSLNQTQIFGSPTFFFRHRPTQQANLNLSTQPYRATEMNLAIYNNVDGQAATTVITDLRKELWKEHLGYASPTHTDLSNRPAAGWLSLWNTKADEKRTGLRQTPIQIKTPRILKWTSISKQHSDSEKFLKEMVGYTDTTLRILSEVPAHDF